MSSSESLKQSFISSLGEAAWNPSWEAVSKLDPEILQPCINLMAVPKKKNHLSPKFQCLVSLAVDAASTHLYIPGIQQHIKAAAASGATIVEVMEVLELSSTLGIHACNIGIPILVDVMKEEGVYDEHPTASKPFDDARLKLKEDFVAKRGYWHTFWEDFLSLDPELFGAYTEFSSVPWVRSMEKPGVGLSSLEKELIYCAFDAAATHLYVSGLKEHMRNALKYGGTPEQIVEVLELATPLSLHTLNVAAPIVKEVYNV